MTPYRGSIRQKSLLIFLSLTAMTVLVCGGAFWQTTELNRQNAKLVQFFRSTSALRKYSSALKRIAAGTYFVARGNHARGDFLIRTGQAEAKQYLEQAPAPTNKYLDGLRQADRLVRKLEED